MQQLTSSTLISKAPLPSPTASRGVRIENLDPEALEQLRQDQASAVYGGIVSAPLAEPDVVARSSPASDQASSRQAVSGRPASSQPRARTQRSTRTTWSPALQTLLDQPPSSFPRRLMLGGVVFGLVLGGWAWFGQVQEVSHARGRLVPQGDLYKVQPVTQGEIAKLRVVEGQAVQVGQVIAELDNRLAASDLMRLQQSLTALELRLFQIQELIQRTQLEAGTRRQIAAATQQAQIASIEQAQAQTRAIQALLPQLQTEQAAYAARLARLQPLVSEGAIAEDRLFEVEQSLRQQQQTLTQHQGDLEQAESERKQLQAELVEKQAEAQKLDLEAQRQVQQLKIQQADVKAQIAETKVQIQAAQTRMGNLFLYAPVAGTVTSLKIHNPGEVAQPGQTVAEIAPAARPLVLSALLPTREAGLVRPGMTAQLKFDAFPYQNYGLVAGKVLSISPDVEVNEQLGAVYQIKIRLDRSSISQKGQKISLKAGQTAQAEIVVRKHRLMDVLLEPIRRLQGDITL
ncbi:MAG: HlyD family type I secretion periplasmic adaptor subunit [Elainella sp.]